MSKFVRQKYSVMTSRALNSAVAKSSLSAPGGFEMYLTISLSALSSRECLLVSSTSSGGRAFHASLTRGVVGTVVFSSSVCPSLFDLFSNTSPDPILFGTAVISSLVFLFLSVSKSNSQSQSESSSSPFCVGCAGEGSSIG